MIGPPNPEIPRARKLKCTTRNDELGLPNREIADSVSTTFNRNDDYNLIGTLVVL